MARFQREAEVLASLNHPNIATIHGVEDNALVMELVEGESPKGPMPFDDARKIASQIAAALEYAHEKGIVHRDLKPANIKVTPDGVVKLLDFGLAKAFSAEATSASASEDPANSPTLTMGATVAGVIMGTAGYMAPEQAKGKRVDKRADIWAWGVVLYELLTGERLFKGSDVADTLAQVLTKQPDIEKVPPQVRRLLRRCLERDPRQRLRDIGEARFFIEGDSLRLPASSKSATRWKIASAVLAIASLALAFVAYRHWNEELRLLKVFIPPPEKGSFAPANSIPAVSPDGRSIAFIAIAGGRWALWVRDLDSLAPRQLPGTDEAIFPFWSPDSRAVAFFSGGKLKKIALAGGPAVVLCDAPNGFGGSWNKDDVIVFAPGLNSGILRVPAAGGMAMPVTMLDQAATETSHRYPWFLPDGHHFLFTARNANAAKTTIEIGDLGSQSHRPVLVAASNAAYSPPRYLLFVRERTLMAQHLDASKIQTTGEAVPIAEDIDFPRQVFGEAQFSVSQNGVLAFTSGVLGGDTQLTWFDRSGAVKGTLGKPGDQSQWPAISPDGKTVVVERRDPRTGDSDLWTYDLATGSPSRLTFGPPNNQWPVWSPDGSFVVFNSTRAGFGSVYRPLGHWHGSRGAVGPTRVQYTSRGLVPRWPLHYRGEN
jgi:serine/threonine-protein kinase